MPRERRPPLPLAAQTTVWSLSHVVILAKDPVMTEAARVKVEMKYFLVTGWKWTIEGKNWKICFARTAWRSIFAVPEVSGGSTNWSRKRVVYVRWLEGRFRSLREYGNHLDHELYEENSKIQHFSRYDVEDYFHRSLALNTTLYGQWQNISIFTPNQGNARALEPTVPKIARFFRGTRRMVG